MNPAKLDTKISLFRRVTTNDAAGGPVETHQLIASPWAEKTDQGSRMFRSFGALHAETTTLFRIRFIEIADADFSVSCGGASYKLTVPPYEVDGRRAWLLMQARRVK